MEVSTDGKAFENISVEGNLESEWASITLQGTKYELPRDIRSAKILSESSYMRGGAIGWGIGSFLILWLLATGNGLAALVFGSLGVFLTKVHLAECEVKLKSGETMVLKSKNKGEGKGLKALQGKVRERNIRDCSSRVIQAIDSGIDDRQLSLVLKEQLAYSGLTEKSELVAMYAHIGGKALEDGRIEPEEYQQLKHLQRLLGLSDSELPVEVGKDLVKLHTLSEIASGVLPVVNVPSLIPEKGEMVHWSEPAQFLEEKITQGYKGGHHGFNVKISKSVNYRVAANRGKLVTERKVEAVDVGKLIVTNRRIVYSGTTRAFTIRTRSLANIECFANGVKLIDQSDKIRLLQYSTRENAEICNTIILRVANSASNAD